MTHLELMTRFRSVLNRDRCVRHTVSRHVSDSNIMTRLRAPTQYWKWKYWKGMELWNPCSRPWKSVEFF